MEDTFDAPENEWRLFTNPYPALWTGLAATASSLVLCLVLTTAGLNWWPVWLIPLLVGLAATAMAVVIAPRSPGNLFFASAAPGMAFFIAHQSKWDISAAFLFGTLAALAVAAGLLFLMPQIVRRVAVSLFIVFHFSGILCAVASAPPQSWLMGQLFETLYRPYLQAVYLTNAYHFYSPEPGPATMLWFRIEYEPDADGTRYSRWVKLPNLDEKGQEIDYTADGSPRRLPRVEYTRRLSLVENASSPAGNLPPRFQDYKIERLRAGEALHIPAMVDVPYEMQYREPAPVSKLWLSVYVRHVARTYKHADKPEKPVVAVKIYRIVHQIPYAYELADGRPFDDPASYFPYYQGEYEPDGTMKKSCRELVFDENGNIQARNHDPFLYFQIPIIPDLTPQTKHYNYKVKNYLRKHAGDGDENSMP